MTNWRLIDTDTTAYFSYIHRLEFVNTHWANNGQVDNSLADVFSSNKRVYPSLRGPYQQWCMGDCTELTESVAMIWKSVLLDSNMEWSILR